MTDFENDLRIVIIEENGSSHFIFSSSDNSCKNTTVIDGAQDFDMVLQYYNSIKDATYQGNNYFDKHITYLKKYLEEHFVKGFQDRYMDPQDINDDLWIYYFLADMGNTILVNSQEHINLFITPPQQGISDSQYDMISELVSLFSDKTHWELAADMQVEVIEENGSKYGILNAGESVSGNLKKVLSSCPKKEMHQAKK